MRISSPGAEKGIAPSVTRITKALEHAQKVWAQYGINLEFGKIEEVEDSEFASIQSTEDGKGELPVAIKKYYQNNPVFLFVEKIVDSEATGGLTSNDLNGAVSWVDDGNVVAHELGHVFIGLGHPEIDGNLMMDRLADHVSPTTIPWLNPAQVKAARDRIVRMQWTEE